MEYVSLYRRFRPDTFSKVIGQDHIVRTVKNQIKNNRISHAYLFTGTRGTGKTSCAKIFARAVNCLTPVDGSPCGECSVCKELSNPSNIDIIEIDAASNNGVDEIRELRENAQYRPSYGRYKVYIVDEVHMLSSSAFNALLKTLEEPPRHVIFVLATTEVQKLPQTILSRCMRFDFRLVGVEELIGLLQRIFDELGVTYEDKALRQIAIHGEGSVRDTLSIADMCMSFGGDSIRYEDVLNILRASDFDTLHALCVAILNGDSGEALTVSDILLQAGRSTIARDLANYFTELLSVKNIKNYRTDGYSYEEREKLIAAGSAFSNYRIARAMDIMAGLEQTMRFSSQPRILLEASIVKAAELSTDLNFDALTNRVKELEKSLRELKENGMVYPESAPVLVKKESQASNSDTPVQPVLQGDFMRILSEKTQGPSEESPIFEEKAVPEGSEPYAGEVWGRITAILSKRETSTLSMAVSSITSGVRLEGKRLVLRTSDKATLQLFMRDSYRAVVSELVRAELGEDFYFHVEEDIDRTKSIPEGDKLLLEQLFREGQKK